MPAPKTRTAILMPHYITFMRVWFGTFAKARRELNLKSVDPNDFWRLTRGECGREEHVTQIAKAMREYGKKRNLQGWKEC